VVAITAQEAVSNRIVDDIGFPKQGKMPPSVHRQYSGTLGKTGDSQIAVSVTVATPSMRLPVAMDLYLPKSSADDCERSMAAHIPDNVVCRPK